MQIRSREGSPPHLARGGCAARTTSRWAAHAAKGTARARGHDLGGELLDGGQLLSLRGRTEGGVEMN